MATEEAARLGAARPLAVAYALLGCFFLAERLLPQGPDAASLEAGTTDQCTTRAMMSVPPDGGKGTMSLMGLSG